MSFARTKIQPPQPRAGSLVERPALQARLAEALATQRLVLVSAAAGFGKTSALVAALASHANALAWVAADEGDDLHRLLECLVAALEPFDPPWRTAPEGIVAQCDDARGRVRAAAEIINALDACDVGHGVIVFDDLHRVDDGPFFAFLETLLERLGARWTVAVTTRSDPPLPLARLRALGELAEFRQADLQFDREETRALGAAAGIDAAAADALFERTGGWPAGVRLGLTRGAVRAPGASDRAMFDFLASEVIGRIEPALREFLLRTSVLPELTATRAAAVAGDALAAQRLEQVDRLGLFTNHLDAAEPTLKLHDLFREALTRELRRQHADEWAALWRRAAAGENDPTRRITMLLAGGHLADAAEVLAVEVRVLLTEGALTSVVHLVDQFPGDFVAASPVMQLVLGQLSWARWDFASMHKAMARAEAGFLAAGQADRARAAAAYDALALNALGHSHEVSARLGALRREAVAPETRVVVLVACTWHALDLGSIHRVGPLQDELMDLLEHSDDASLWYQAHPLPRINGLPDTARALRRFVRGALRLAGERPMPLRALAHVQRGLYHAWQEGELAAAETALRTAQDDSRWLGNPPNVKTQIQLLSMIVQTMRGQRASALATAQALIDEHPAMRGRWALWANVYYAARVAALFEDRERLEERMTKLEHADDVAAPPSQLPLLEALRGHRAWLAGDRAAAIAHWQRVAADAHTLDRLGHRAEAAMFLAAALLEGGRTAEAAQALAFVFAAAADGVGPMLLARPALRRLAAADWRGQLAPERIAELRRWWSLAQGEAADEGDEGEATEPLLEGGLSAREIEVLGRIAAGDSNKHIARAFDLSPHTVKRHVANILDKLGVDSRGQAAAWYRARAQ